MKPVRKISPRGVLAKLILLLAVLWSLAPDARAADKLSGIGPSAGADLGKLLNLSDQDGKPRDFASLKGKNGMILVFSRSLSWCPFCVADARDWSTIAEQAWSHGVNITVVTYDPVDTLADFSRRFGIRYPLLSDTDSKLIKTLGILNDEHRPGSVAHGIPHPMVFVLDANGVLFERFSETNYTHRADKNEVLAGVARMAKDK